MMKNEIVTVQWLRGLAALSVVVQHTAFKCHQYHYDILTGYNVGSFGVDLFFIISGFIMCHVIDEKTTPAVFLRKRLTRILPLYWVLSLVAFGIYIINPSLVNSSGGKTDIISSIFLTPPQDKLLLQNGWSLSYELFFYLIIVASLFFGRKYLCLFSSVVIFLLVVTGLVVQPQNRYSQFVTSTLFIEFIMGFLAYYIYRNMKKINPFAHFVVFCIGIAMIVCQSSSVAGFDEKYRFLYAGFPVLLIFIAFVLNEDRAKKISLPAFEKLGLISYSLYLSHPFVLSPLSKILSKITSGAYFFSCSLVLLSVISGWLCYKLIEVPLSKLVLTNTTKKHHAE